MLGTGLLVRGCSAIHGGGYTEGMRVIVEYVLLILRAGALVGWQAWIGGRNVDG